MSKSAIAGVLVILGFCCLGATFMMGENVDEDAAQKWQEERGPQYEQAMKRVHGGGPGATLSSEERQAAREEVKKFDAEIEEMTSSAGSPKKILWYAGLGLAFVGIVVQIWAWSDQQ